MVRNRSNLSAQEKRARLMRASQNNRAVAIAQTKDTRFSTY